MTRLEYVDFQRVRRKLRELLKKTRRVKQRVALQILYIQLVNGARVSEAIEAYYEFVKDPSTRRIYVRVRKSKKNKTREIVIPREIEPINIKITKRYIQYVCKKYLKTNTHSLRYAFITFMAKQNIPYQVVAKITKHSNLNLIEHYTQELIAQKLLHEIAK